jgi:hypothetical protein
MNIDCVRVCPSGALEINGILIYIIYLCSNDKHENGWKERCVCKKNKSNFTSQSLITKTACCTKVRRERDKLYKYLFSTVTQNVFTVHIFCYSSSTICSGMVQGEKLA